MRQETIELRLQMHIFAILVAFGLLCLFMAFGHLNYLITTSRHIFSLMLSLLFFLCARGLFNTAFMRWRFEEDKIEIRSLFYKRIIIIEDISVIRVNTLGSNLMILFENEEPTNLNYVFFSKKSTKQALIFLESSLKINFTDPIVNYFLGR